MASDFSDVQFFDGDDGEGFQGFFPERKMIIIKTLDNGDIHAEDTRGQMVIVKRNGKVKTFLDGDTKWVKGRIDGEKLQDAWDVIGFYLGMTNGKLFEQARKVETIH